MKVFYPVLQREIAMSRFHNSYFVASLALSMAMGVVVAGISPLGSRTAHAATQTWDNGAADQDWNNAVNWTGDAFPNGGGSNAIINTSGTTFPIISANSAFTPQDVFLGSGAGNSGRLDHRAGSLSLNDTSANGNWFFVGRESSTATGVYNLADTSTAGGGISGFAQGSGDLTVGKLWVGGAAFGDNGSGTVNMNTTGSITANSTGFDPASVIVGGYNTTGAVGTINLESGTIQAAGEVWLGRAGSGTVNQSGGIFNSTGYFVIARGWEGNGGTGVYNLTGGTVNAATSFGFAALGSTRGGSGTLSVSGGAFNSLNGIRVGEAFFNGNGAGTGTGIINISGTGVVNAGTNTAEGIHLGVFANAVGTLNLNGGTLQTAIVKKGAGSGTFNFNGGTLQATATNASYMTGLTAANVQSGGAIIDTNSFDITIGQTLLDGGGGGGLTKNGGGTLTLTATNTFTGATTISGGTLQLGNGGATGSISSTGNVTNNGTLAVNRNNAVTQGTDFGTITSGTGGVSQLGTGSTLTLNTANTYSGTTSIGTAQNNAVLQATASGALGSGTVLFDLAGNGSTARLELLGNTTLSNPIAFTGRNNPSVGIQSVSGNNTLSGTVSGGAGGGTYTIQSDAGLLTLSNPTAITHLSNSGTRTFSLQGAGNGLVSGTIEDGSAGATVAIDKAGAGKWTLSGTNTYSGTTTVNAGTLAVNGSNTGTGAVAVNDGGTLAGSGAVAGDVMVNSGGTLAPGASIESFAVGALTFAGDPDGNGPLVASTFAVELDTSEPLSVAADLVNASGDLTIANNSAILSLVDLDSTAGFSGKLTLISYTGTWNSGIFLNTPDDSLVTVGLNTYVINYNDTAAGGNFTPLTGNYLTLTAVPEASAFLFGGVVCLVIGLIQVGRMALRKRAAG